MSNSNYVLAGFETLGTIVNNFMLNKKNCFHDNFTRECISKFHNDTTFGFLHSFGQNFTGRKTYHNYVKSEVDMYTKCRDFGLFNGSLFISDSGGFQSSIGKLKNSETQMLIKLYHEFLRDHHSCIDRAFILDLVPGPGCDTFKNFDDVYNLNLQTYSMAANLPDEARKKIIYIQHFRTPKLYEIFDRLLKENDFFDKFEYFATGGIVASMGADSTIPCIIYVIPLIQLLNQAIIHRRTKLHFHILGGAGFREILFYELIQKHVQAVHGIELTISYDSSGLFKGLMIGRFVPAICEGNLCKLDIRSCNIDMRFGKSSLVKDVFIQELNDLANRYGFKRLNGTKIYDDKTGTFYEDVKVYAMFYMLDFYSKIQARMKIFADQNYELYTSGNFEELNRRIDTETQNLNDGKITPKQKAKMSSLIKSLDMLTSLDEDYSKHIVKKSLSKDEFTELMNKPTILSF